jgi:hypothetical protein
VPNERAGWDCGPAIQVVGVVVQTPGCGWVFEVRFEGDRVRRQSGYTAVFVDAQTLITRFERHGLPSIEEGDRLAATVRECIASGGP